MKMTMLPAFAVAVGPAGSESDACRILAELPEQVTAETLPKQLDSIVP